MIIPIIDKIFPFNLFLIQIINDTMFIIKRIGNMNMLNANIKTISPRNPVSGIEVLETERLKVIKKKRGNKSVNIKETIANLLHFFSATCSILL